MQQLVKKKSTRILLVLLVVVGVLWLGSLHSYLTLPNVAFLKRENPKTWAFKELYEGKRPPEHIWVSYTRISPYLKNAVVIAEDSRFFDHHGFDLEAIWEALQRNWDKKQLRWGGSTITQQLAKNLYLNPSKNPFRKIKEIFIAFALEKNLSKQRILELYLNVVEWGEGIYGAEAAARHYFGLSAAQLSPAQSARLAAILPNPRHFQHQFYGAYLKERVETILRRMGY